MARLSGGHYISAAHGKINTKSDLIMMVCGIFFALFINFPNIWILWLILSFISIVVITIAPSPENIANRTQRINALKIASIYLSPYKNIWKNLKLSNKHCTLKLENDGVSITATEKNNFGDPYRKFRVLKSNTHSYRKLWDMFCISFDYQTTYDRLLELCHLYNTQIYETTLGLPSISDNKINIKPESKNTNVKEKLDINNASEIEITALPGISIVLSKKLIKKREEIGGFKTLDDVFLFLKLKPHMENQLRSLVCVKKMKGSVKIERFEERKIDL